MQCIGTGNASEAASHLGIGGAKSLNVLGWNCIHATDFQQAEVYVRRLIDLETALSRKCSFSWSAAGYNAQRC
jgi:hypothetical protein